LTGRGTLLELGVVDGRDWFRRRCSHFVAHLLQVFNAFAMLLPVLERCVTPVIAGHENIDFLPADHATRP
jgi:hypothetical protein